MEESNASILEVKLLVVMLMEMMIGGKEIALNKTETTDGKPTDTTRSVTIACQRPPEF